jgi:hypothetical protein
VRIRLAALLVAGMAFSSLPAHSVDYGLEGVRHFDHVVVLVLENQNYDTSWGPGSVAHYLNSLRAEGVFADQYFATGHVSLDNYITMVSGQPWNPVTGSDCATVNLWMCVQAQQLFSHGRHLGDQLDAYGLSWKGYMDGMPSPCFHADYSPTAIPPDPYQGNSVEPPAFDYADRHNPWIYFKNVIGNDARCKAHDVPYTHLATDLAANALPAFSFITPDTCNDGHDAPCANGKPGGLTTADAWLQQEVPPLLDYLRANNGILLITFDENGFTAGPPFGCCHGGIAGLPGFGGRIGLLALGAGLTPGKVVHTKYDHASLLRTLEDSFGIGWYLNNAKVSRPMVDVFGP